MTVSHLRLPAAGAICLLVLALACFTTPIGAAESPSRPNLILIVSDDQGWGDLGCHGNPVLDTPHLDDMSRRGISLSRFYVSPVCSPTRAALMTGRYNQRTRVNDTYLGRSMLEPAEVTVAELLRDGGYATGIFGKWHLGDCYPMRPQDQGFESTVVMRGGGLAQPSDPLENERRYTNPILWRNGEQFQAEGYITKVIFDEALAFIGQAASDDRPFFAYIATNAPHGPFHDVPMDLYEKYRQRDLSPVLLGNRQTADTVARVYAMVEDIDRQVGRLVEGLEARGLDRNTLVIFMCDNGPNTERYVGECRGMKTNVHEGGIRSPLLAIWPGQIAPGSTSRQLSAHIDLVPTLLAAAGIEVPDGLKLDGKNLLPVLRDPHGTQLPARQIVLQIHRGGTPVAGHHVAVVGDRWKLLRPTGFNKIEPTEDLPYQLFDLAADPYERHDQATEHPQIVARLRRYYEDWFAEMQATRPDPFAPPRIVVGTDAEPITTLTWQDWQAKREGWGTEGVWLLEAPNKTDFQVTVLLNKPKSGLARLRFNQTSFDQQVSSDTQRIVFDHVTMPAGECDLRFVLEAGDDRIDPYQIVLKRIER